ncbi:GNAT family N-acetyltransferase [Stackebrandtia nassauensis]|uniref:GCN5-related N-acetyltransferase n=1 Tax=Stackebrandtia nassauensis (strain DSM 44728 / CIP 108903 / NRRL B-16338 / NBRC 102104 / LLR-40K-21) TaxID=446470 RepID=D3QBJ7_STANL|nr:GNAT family N-acetyltransferase [Stackebrandtia nassauensis]ADD42879.1 GCN5-related N-acetyltransferase [Stackebrandtia nassauensis DSM 44728]
MPELELLRADHAEALLDFEVTNRAYFAASIPDRGDDYFANFATRHAALLTEQATGECFFHVLVDAGGDITGRVNLVDVADGEAELGYRIGASAAGRGLATAAVTQVCALAAESYGLKRLRAQTTLDNIASHKVLTRTGFEPAGDTVLSGRPGRRYLRDLTTQPTPST